MTIGIKVSYDSESIFLAKNYFAEIYDYKKNEIINSYKFFDSIWSKS